MAKAEKQFTGTIEVSGSFRTKVPVGDKALLARNRPEARERAAKAVLSILGPVPWDGRYSAIETTIIEDQTAALAVLREMLATEVP